ETAGFEPAVDKSAHRALRFEADPAVDTVRDDIIELRQLEIDRRSKIDGLQLQVRDRRSRRQPAGMIDVRRHCIDAVEYAARMGRGEDGGGDALAAAEVAPRETISPAGRLDPGGERHIIEPSR